jgi:nicotinamidase-related amidase
MRHVRRLGLALFLSVLSLSAFAQASCNTALLVIDVQKTFVAGGGWNTTTGADIADAVAQALSMARSADIPVIYIKDLTVLLYESVAPSLLEFPDAIAPRAGEPVFTKEFPNPFVNPDVANHLAKQGVERLILCGIASEGCVASALFSAAAKGYEVTVIADAHSNGPVDPTVERWPASKWNETWIDRGVQVIPMREIDWTSFGCSP